MIDESRVLLSPERYECTVDGADLTALVAEELDGEAPAMFNPGRLRPFRVMITCPGSQGGHDVECVGQFRLLDR